jgi:hypothetical protein
MITGAQVIVEQQLQLRYKVSPSVPNQDIRNYRAQAVTNLLQRSLSADETFNENSDVDINIRRAARGSIPTSLEEAFTTKHKIAQVVERQVGRAEDTSQTVLNSLTTFVKSLKLRHPGEGSQSQGQIRMFQKMMLDPHVALDGSVEILTCPKDLNARLVRYGTYLQP